MKKEAAKEKDKKKLRQGYTTGANATAATKAALTALITQQEQFESTIFLPIKKYVTFHMETCEVHHNKAITSVIKDAGDDPDATHRALIKAHVSWREDQEIVLDGGKGVGRVTKEGLPIPVGQAAINPVPRKMIVETTQEVLEEHGIKKGVDIVISVPNGEEIAKKTLNSRLGIVGGISILGTRGIVVPFSTAAYKASIVQAINVAKARGCNEVVITTGGRSEKYGMKQYPDLPEEAFIEMGDFVGFTLKECKRQGIEHVYMVGMMGKFSKVAQGVMMVHSKSASVDFHFIAQVAKEVGADESLIDQVKEANTATQAADLMIEHGYPEFIEKMCAYCCESALREVKGGLYVETSLYTLKGEFLGKAVQDGRNH